MNIWLEAPDGRCQKSYNISDIRSIFATKAWYNKNGIQVPNLWHEYHSSKSGNGFLGESIWNDIIRFQMDYEDRLLFNEDGLIDIGNGFMMDFIEDGGNIFGINKIIIYKGGEIVYQETNSYNKKFENL